MYCDTLIPTVRHPSSTAGEGNEYMGKGFMITPQTSESFEHVFIYRRKPVVHRQTTQLGFEEHFIFFLDMEMCVFGEWFHLRSIPTRQKARVACMAPWDAS